MGKIKVKTLGLEGIEDEQKKAAKIKREQKNLRKNAGKEADVVVVSEKIGKSEKEEIKEMKPEEEKNSNEDVIETEEKSTEVEPSDASHDAEAMRDKKAMDGKEKSKKKKKEVKVHVFGKKYLINKAKVDKNNKYSVTQGVAILKTFKSRHFDESIELHATVNAQNIKGEVSLPHGTGKSLKVSVVDDKLIEG